MGRLTSLSVFLVFLIAVSVIDTTFGRWHKADTEKTVAEIFIESELVPDVISVPPETLLEVTYDAEAGISADGGNYLLPSQVQNEPTLLFDSQPDRYYTIVMIDPDAPSQTDRSEAGHLHWLVVNSNSDRSVSETLVTYLPSGPPEGSGYHRYTFLVYEQPSELNFSDLPDLNKNRSKFSIEEFAERYGLGNSISGNYFLAQHEERTNEEHNS